MHEEFIRKTTRQTECLLASHSNNKCFNKDFKRIRSYIIIIISTSILIICKLKREKRGLINELKHVQEDFYVNTSGSVLFFMLSLNNDNRK